MARNGLRERLQNGRHRCGGFARRDLAVNRRATRSISSKAGGLKPAATTAA
jgi:hypothetical protein